MAGDARLVMYRDMTLRQLQLEHRLRDMVEARARLRRDCTKAGLTVPTDYQVVDSVEGANLIAAKKLPGLTRKNYRG